MAILSDWARMFGSWEKPEFDVLRDTKNPYIDKGQKWLFRDFRKARESGAKAIADYAAELEASEPEFRRTIGQETKNIDSWFDGSSDAYLQQLRNREATARRSAGDRALDFAQGGVNRLALLRGSPGDSSADRAMRYRAARDIEDQIALSDVARERSDFDYSTKMRSMFTGRRNALLDQLIGRKLRVQDLTNSQLAQSIQALSGILGIDQANNFYGLWKEKNDWEKAADVGDQLANTAMTVLQAYMGGMGGGMGGGAAGAGAGGSSLSGIGSGGGSGGNMQMIQQMMKMFSSSGAPAGKDSGDD